MAVKGKERYQIFLTSKYVEILRAKLDKTKGTSGLSQLIDSLLANYIKTVLNVDIEGQKRESL